VVVEKKSRSFIDMVSLPQVRRISVVVDLEDKFTPAMNVEDFVKEFGFTPEPPRYKVVSVEALTCAQDGQPVLVGECGRCPKFIRRTGERIYCRAAVGI